MSQIQTISGGGGSGISGSGTATATWSSNITNGNRLIVYVYALNSTATQTITVTDSAGNTYNELLGDTGDLFGAKTAHAGIWMTTVTAGAGTTPTITVSLTSAGTFCSVALTAEERTEAFTGLDVSSSGTATYGVTHDSGTSAAASAGSEYLVSYCLAFAFSTVNISVGSSSPALTKDTNLSLGSIMAVASGATASGATCGCVWSFNTNDGGMAIIAAFTSGAGANTNGFFRLM